MAKIMLGRNCWGPSTLPLSTTGRSLLRALQGISLEKKEMSVGKEILVDCIFCFAAAKRIDVRNRMPVSLRGGVGELGNLTLTYGFTNFAQR
jgi:hypothetical protein